MHDSFRGKRIVTVLGVVALAGLLAVSAVMFAGCNNTQAQQNQFKAQWVKIMQQLQARIAADDKKGQDLVAKNDLPGVIALTKKRVTNADETLGQILKLYPPDNLRRLDVLSSFYLVTLIDRLNQQVSLYDAILNNRPTTDITTVLNELIARNQTIARELGIELQKDGISIEPPSQKTPSSTPTSAPSSVPSQ